MSNDLLNLHMQQDQDRFDRIDKQLEAGDARMKNIDEKLNVLIATANKQKGFLAGVSMAFSLLATTVAGLIVYIWQRWSGQ